jgi:hypothetical protein
MYKKHWRIQKTSADGKISAHPKSLADGKNSAHRKILVSIEMLAPGKNFFQFSRAFGIPQIVFVFHKC